MKTLIQEWALKNKVYAVITVTAIVVVIGTTLLSSLAVLSTKPLERSKSEPSSSRYVSAQRDSDEPKVLGDDSNIEKLDNTNELAKPAQKKGLTCDSSYQASQEKIYLDTLKSHQSAYSTQVSQTKVAYADMKKTAYDINSANQREYESLVSSANFYNKLISDAYFNTVGHLTPYGCVPSIQKPEPYQLPSYPTYAAKATPTIAQCNEQLRSKYKSEYDQLVATENTEFNQLMAYINNSQNFDNSGNQIIAHTNATNTHKKKLAGYKSDYEAGLRAINCSI